MKITLKNGGLEDLLSRSRTQKELEKIVAETKTRTTMQLYLTLTRSPSQV